MNAHKTRRSGRPLKKSLVTDFRDSLNQFLRELGKDNSYAAFLFELVRRNLERLSKRKDLPFSKYFYPGVGLWRQYYDCIEHNLPIDEKFRFLPSQINLDFVYGNHQEIPFWHKSKKYPTAPPLGPEAYCVQKNSLIIKKIFSLAKGVSIVLEKISRRTRCPVVNLQELFTVITTWEKSSSIDSDWQPQGPSVHTFIPQFIPGRERDKYLSDVARQVYDLLEEAFFVLMILGMVECQRFRSPGISGDFQKMQEYLLKAVCYRDMEKRVAEAKSISELEEYFQKEFSVFDSFYPRFIEFYKNSVEPLIQKGLALRTRPTNIQSDDSIRHIVAYSDVERIQNQGFQPIFEEKDSNGNGSERCEDWDNSQETDQDSGENSDEEDKDWMVDHVHSLSGEEYEDSMRTDSDTYNRPVTPDYSQLKWERKAFSDELDMVFTNKLLKGLLSTYKLMGSPYNLIGYIKAIFKNSAGTVIERDYNEFLKVEKGMSTRTERRRKKELREEKNLMREDRHEQDKNEGLDDYQIEIMRRRNFQKQTHRVPGFLTQNQLIEAVIDGDPKRPGYSPTSLKRKIKELVARGIIQCEIKDGVYRFQNLKETVDKVKRAIKNP